MNNLKSKDLLGTKDLTINEINLIFETAKKFKEVLSRPIKKVPTLRHLTIANIFLKIAQEQNYRLNLLKKDYLQM